MDDATGLAEALLGLEGFQVLDVAEGPDELVVTVESAAQVVGCQRCGVRAEAQDRMAIRYRAAWVRTRSGIRLGRFLERASLALLCAVGRDDDGESESPVLRCSRAVLGASSVVV